MIAFDFPYNSGANLAFSLKQQATGLWFDFTTTVLGFVASPLLPTAVVPENPGIWRASYSGSIAATPVANFPDGAYIAFIHDNSYLKDNVASVVGVVGIIMKNGSCAPFQPSQLAVALSGTFPASGVLS